MALNMALNNLMASLSFPATFTIASRSAATVAILCIFFSFFFVWLLNKRRNGARLPPGPYALPIIGNLHQLGLPVQFCLKGLADKYGPILFLRLGSVPTVVVSSSEMAKQFFQTHDLIFASRPPTAASKLIFFNSKDVIFAPYGDHWRHVRKICVLELLSAKRIQSFKHVREEEVSAMIRSIWEESDMGRKGVNVSKAISTLTSNITWRMLVKRKFSDDDLSGDFGGFNDLVAEVSATVDEFNIGDFIPYLQWLDLQGLNRRAQKVHKTFSEFAEKIIEEHVNVNHLMAEASNGQEEVDGEPHVQDFVDVLLQMEETGTKITREIIKALVLDMYVAGVETTSDTLEGAISQLLRHPHAMKRLQEEIESVVGQHGQVKESNLATMKYLHCVVKETLRLYPAAPLAVPHESVEAVTVGGYYIPKKTTVLVNLWAIGRDPNVWGTDASKFKPERFMEEEHVNLTDQSDFSMIPFGAGRRGCPGGSMAIPTMELALAQLVHTFNWRVEGDSSQLDINGTCGVTVPWELLHCVYPKLRVTFPL